MRFVRILLAVILTVLLSVSPVLAASMTVVTNRTADVHQSASTSSASVSVQKGLKMKLTGYSDGWGKVSLKGRTGYVRLKYLDLKKPLGAYVSRDVAMYADAGAGKLGTLSKGTKVYFVGVDGDYARVTDSHRTYYGYVDLNALTTKQTGSSVSSTASSTGRSKIDRVLRTAQQLMGKPYALNADPPSSFNCAALVKYCFNSAKSGCMNSSLGDQVHDERYAKINSIGSLKRGDLVCFNISGSTDRIGHVGIYIGDGWFVHASATEGKVTVSKLTSGYYKRSFSWGRRVFDN